ncbi:MAG TPA: S8 family peptidase [Geminicoccaceae bacterium]|nr:S8 family peptidase [Geminicoccus sp.]HMU52115.1 S8 family peptidase [Geminicoccaceae bacterium]
MPLHPGSRCSAWGDGVARLGIIVAAGLSLAACAPGRQTALPLVAPAAAPAADRAARLAAERRRSTGLLDMHVAPALAKTAGKGVDVAVIDTGIDARHVEFRGRIHPLSGDIAGGSLLGPSGHGTHVAGIIGAARDARGMSGIAPAARLLALRADARDAACPDGGCSFRDADLARAVDQARLARVEVINLSLSKPEPLEPVLTAALRRAALSGALIVVAAGNGDSAEATWPARLATVKGLAGRLLVVGAVDRKDALWAYSNRPGDPALARQFVVAPGVDVLSTLPGGKYGRASGTSMAAAQASGAAALLKSLFPELPMWRIARLLRTTARDLGEPGTDAVFGAGAIDLAAAIAPQGGLRSDTGVALAGSSFMAGAAFGDGPSRALGRNVSARDRLGRAYTVGMDDAVAAAGIADPVGAWLRQPERVWRGGELPGAGFGAAFDDDGEAEAWQVAGTAGPAGWMLGRGLGVASDGPGLFLAGDSIAALVDDPTTFGLDFAVAEHWSLQLRHAPARDQSLQRVGLEGRWQDLVAGLTLDRLSESDGPLGSRGEGALATGEAVSHLAGLSLRWQPRPAVQLGLSGTIGSTEVDGGPARWGNIASTAWSLHAVLSGALLEDDRLGLRLGQPLRVEHGSARFRLDGGDAVDLAPSGREIDLELAWEAAIADGTGLAASLLLAHEAGHDEGRLIDGGLGLRLRHRF